MKQCWCISQDDTPLPEHNKVHILSECVFGMISLKCRRGNAYANCQNSIHFKYARHKQQHLLNTHHLHMNDNSVRIILYTAWHGCYCFHIYIYYKMNIWDVMIWFVNRKEYCGAASAWASPQYTWWWFRKQQFSTFSHVHCSRNCIIPRTVHSVRSAHAAAAWLPLDKWTYYHLWVFIDLWKSESVIPIERRRSVIALSSLSTRPRWHSIFIGKWSFLFQSIKTKEKIMSAPLCGITDGISTGTTKL